MAVTAMKLVAPLLLLALGSSAAASVPDIVAHKPVRTYTIDLDQAPETRYNDVFADTANGFNTTVWDFFNKYFAHDFILRDALYGVGKIRGKENPEMQAEIEGMAAVSGLPVPFLQSIQMLYELQTVMVPIVNFTGPAVDFIPPGMEWLKHLPWQGPGCTGIIAMCSDGKVYHARNLDFAPLDIMSRLVYDARFVRGGEELFTAQMVAGYTQVVTGIRRGDNGYTLERNTRFTTHFGGNFEMLKNLFTGRTLNGWTLRKTLENSATYEGAVAMLSETPYASTEYAIIGGVRKGVILARDPDSVAHTLTLGEGQDGQRPDYILITNFDFFFHDKREFFDPTGHGGFGWPTRRGAAQAVLTSVPEGRITPELLWRALNTKYVYADTVFQATMSAEAGLWNVSQPVFSK